MEKEISRKAKEHEDAALKLSMQFFANELLPYLNIHGKVIEKKKFYVYNLKNLIV